MIGQIEMLIKFNLQKSSSTLFKLTLQMQNRNKVKLGKQSERNPDTVKKEI